MHLVNLVETQSQSSNHVPASAADRNLPQGWADLAEAQQAAFQDLEAAPLNVDLRVQQPPEQGWPDVDEAAIGAFQQWYPKRMDAQKNESMAAVHSLQLEAEEAEQRQEIVTARHKLRQAKDLTSELEGFGSTEHMRKAAWLFTDRATD